MKPRPTESKKKERTCIACGCLESSHSKSLLGNPKGPRIFCAAIEDRNHPCKGVYDSERAQVPTRTIYVRDDERTRVGFATHGQASKHADTILPQGRDGSRDSDAMRVRVAYRRRTETFDVVVKAARQVPIVEAKAIGE
jgi:hypothetical protein